MTRVYISVSRWGLNASSKPRISEVFGFNYDARFDNPDEKYLSGAQSLKQA